MMESVAVLLALCVTVLPVEARYLNRVWTYQSTSRVDAMGMGFGVSYSMLGRGRHDYVTGKQEIYKTTDDVGTLIDLPSAVWIGSCVYESDEGGFLRCVGRKSPIYNLNTNKPICTANVDADILTPDTYCDNPYEHHYRAPYDPGDPTKRADYVGDKYGAHLSLAGDLELGKMLAVGAPKSFDDDGSPMVAPGTFFETYGAVYMYTGEYKHWTENQKLLADDSNVELVSNIPDFGRRVEFDRVTSRTLMVSCPVCVYSDKSEGSMYVYRTEDGKFWSNTQQLRSDDAETDTWEFSRNMRVYDDFMLVSAAGLNHLGAAYIFREERHSLYKGGIYNGIWTQQQRLIPTDAYIRSSGEMFGEKMALHGKTLVITQNRQPLYGDFSGAAYVYESHKTLEYIDTDWIGTNDGHRRLHPKPKPKPMHKWWTQVQRLFPSDPHVYRFFGDEVSIWGDVIAIMGGGDGLDDGADWSDPNMVTYQFGSIYMFTRSRSDINAWTQQQKLYNPDANDGTYFSTPVDQNYQNYDVGLKDNRFGLPRLHGTSFLATSASQHGYFMTDTNLWKCLLITVSDGMGDGWDRARLVATAPTDPKTRELKHDTYSQYCDAYNYDKSDETKHLSRKLQETYRYCPLSPEDDGDYIFEVMGNPRGKKGNKGTPSDDLYWREIYWDIYNEHDEKRYIGDAHTKLTFNWGSEDFFFTLKKAERLWKAPDPCSQCNVWDGIKKPKRNLNDGGSDGDEDRRRLNLYPTPSPTASIAPTMRWDQHNNLEQWTFFMGRNDTTPSSAFGSTTPWVDKSKNGTGTYFYIYDSNGLNITEPLIWGQLCTLTGTIKDSCTTQDLPVGGTYTLRVTGGTDYRRQEIMWKFCNRIGHAMESLVFTKYSSTCLPLAQYSSIELCERNGFKVFTSALQVLKGIYSLYSEKRDSAVIKSALRRMVEPYVVSNIKLFIEDESLHDLGATEDVVLRAEMEFDSEVNGIKVTELDGLHNFEASLVEKLSYFDDNNLIPSILNSASQDILGEDEQSAMTGASLESHFLNVQLISAEQKNYAPRRDRVGSYPFTDDGEGLSDEMTKLTMSRGALLEYYILNAEAIGGYVVVACVAVAVVLVSWRRKAKKSAVGDLSVTLDP